MSKPFRIPELVPKIEELMAQYPMPLKEPTATGRGGGGGGGGATTAPIA